MAWRPVFKPIARRPSAYQAAKPRDMLAWFTQKLRTELRVSGRALSDIFEGTIVQDNQVSSSYSFNG